MVTEAMEQEHHHDHDEDEETTEDSLGSTVVLGKGRDLHCIFLDHHDLYFTLSIGSCTVSFDTYCTSLFCFLVYLVMYELWILYGIR